MKRILCALIAIIGVSCSNDNDTKSTNLESQSNAKREQSSTPSYPNNLYDYAGYYHNILVEEAIDKYGINGDVTSQEVLDQIYNSEYKSVIENNYIGEEFSTTLLPYFSTISIDLETSKQNHQRIINNTYYSTNAKKYMYQIIDVIYSLEENSYDYNTFYNTVVSLEDNVLNDYNLKEDEKSVVLKGASVARYTIDLWLNNYYKTENQTLNQTKGRKWWTWLIVGATDVGAVFAGGKVSDAVAASKFVYEITAPDKSTESPGGTKPAGS